MAMTANRMKVQMMCRPKPSPALHNASLSVYISKASMCCLKLVDGHLLRDSLGT